MNTILEVRFIFFSSSANHREIFEHKNAYCRFLDYENRDASELWKMLCQYKNEGCLLSRIGIACYGNKHS